MAQRLFASGQVLPQIQFGPGMEKAFSDGSLDREELVGRLKEMGLDVL
jgi:hypothetical protein